MWEKRVLPQFQGSNEQAKQQAFVRMQGWIPSTVGPNLGKLTNYRRSKSAFAKLKIDGNIQGFFVHEDFAQYYKAFVTQDKETAKLIQAGNYAESFWRFFNFGDRPVQFNILGYSES